MVHRYHHHFCLHCFLLVLLNSVKVFEIPDSFVTFFEFIWLKLLLSSLVSSLVCAKQLKKMDENYFSFFNLSNETIKGLLTLTLTLTLNDMTKEFMIPTHSTLALLAKQLLLTLYSSTLKVLKCAISLKLPKFKNNR